MQTVSIDITILESVSLHASHSVSKRSSISAVEVSNLISNLSSSS